jgi:uncharacterized protein (DUF58 family)
MVLRLLQSVSGGLYSGMTRRPSLRTLAERLSSGRRQPLQRPEGDPLPTPDELQRYRDLLFAAELVVEGLYAGHHRSPFHDVSAEFSDLRPYVHGDDIRTVDWKALGRSDRLYVRQFRKETDLSAMLVVDTSRSMDFEGGAPLSKLQCACRLAMASALLLQRQGDRPGCALVSDTLEELRPPRGDVRSLREVGRLLSKARALHQTDLSGCLHTLSSALPRRGLLLVISDFLAPVQPLMDALAQFRYRGFAAALWMTLSPEELTLSQCGLAHFVDPETGRKITADADTVRQAYQDELESHISQLRSGAHARGCYFDVVNTAMPLHHVLERYLTARRR